MSSSNFNCASKDRSSVRQAKQECFPHGLGSPAPDPKAATAKDKAVEKVKIASCEAVEDSTQDTASPTRNGKTNPAIEATTKGTQEHTSGDSSCSDGEVSVSAPDIKSFLSYLAGLNRAVENFGLRMEKFDHRMENFGARLEVLGEDMAELRMGHARSIELLEQVADILLEQKMRDGEIKNGAFYKGEMDFEDYMRDM